VDDDTIAELADRAGVEADFAARLRDAGIVGPPAAERYAEGDVRRVRLIHMLVRAGLPLDGIGTAVRNGTLSLDFVDTATYDRFASFSSETFGEVSARTGIPVETLGVIREAAGSAGPAAEDRMRDDELMVVPLIALQLRLGFRAPVVERALRVYGESLRRITETEADWWHSEIVRPTLARGGSWGEVASLAQNISPELSAHSDGAVIALYHARQTDAWMRNIFEGVETSLAAAGIHAPADRTPPAISFLDLTGYTRITDERGDEAAADLAERLSRLVERTSAAHGGRPVKWLGDGVMFHFPDGSPATLAALEMVDAAAAAGLPPARVGVHAGPVLFQEGDYFGRTVNLASRIADVAAPGQVVVTAEVVGISSGANVTFDEIGPVELKGVGGAVRLFAASLDGARRGRGPGTAPTT
jgi:adenylate cyclase